MIIGCYIVDDEAHAIKALSKHIEKTPGLTIIGTDTNPLETWRKFGSELVRPDLTFLDIDMPQLSGIDLAELLRGKTEVIFTTGHPDYALKAFESEALDYLLKPITYERFLKAITRAKERLLQKLPAVAEQEADDFYIKCDHKGKMVKIRFQDIRYIEARANYLRIYVGNHFYTAYLTLKEIQEKLSSRNFIRVHKSFIINIQRIVAVEGNTALLENNDVIDIGASYRSDFLAVINPKLISSKRMS